ncbi:putative kinetochore protein nuf2 [Rhypophila decipiens]|uniref:Probable kinetochore protein NUF2 n=1 Tax=Rhypophila decipiens TaxID=261697 RepID=A0AAN6Y8U7_9PEZI|nr:putative kinetochore protein nuf2 [Rhypophila decipiens]
MAGYNPRMSILPSQHQQSRLGGNGPNNPNQNRAMTQKKQEEEAAYANMRLPDREIVGCINELGIPFTVSDLQKPNPIQVQQIFEWFGEILMNKTRQTVDPAMRAAMEDVVGQQYGDGLMPADARSLMGFFVSLRTLMVHCGVKDFSFADLYRPTHDRLVKIFSYIINFVRFRESQTGIIDEHCNRAEATKQRIEFLFGENQNMEGQLDEMRANRRQMEQLVAEKTRRNEELKKRLLDLRRAQEKVAQRLEDAKIKKGELANELEEKTALKLAMKQDCAKLRPYVLQSATALQNSLTELSNTLNGDKGHIDSLDRRARALQTSTDSFAVVATDVASCIKLLEEIAVELAKEEEENIKNAKQRDALTERGASVREVERTELMLQRQLAKWAERTETLRSQSEEKAARAKEKMEELRAVHKKLSEERGEKGKDIERRRVRIEQTEKKMLDLKENIENEIHAAYDEYLKLESHVKLYITEMEQAI